jgi:uncharacterized protein with HEPN domain
MQRDQRAYLWDVLNSIDLIQQFIGTRTLSDYSQDPMLRAAVERQFEIVGGSTILAHVCGFCGC